jgi:hypothetical protein
MENTQEGPSKIYFGNLMNRFFASADGCLVLKPSSTKD